VSDELMVEFNLSMKGDETNKKNLSFFHELQRTENFFLDSAHMVELVEQTLSGWNAQKNYKNNTVLFHQQVKSLLTILIVFCRGKFMM
jgi:hypothetical protein